MMTNKIKIKIDSRSRNNNMRPRGLLIITLPDNTSMKKAEECRTIAEEAIRDAMSKEKISVLSIANGTKAQYIKL